MKLLKVETVKSAIEQMTQAINCTVEIEEVSLQESVGRYLAQDIVANRPSPHFRKAVVDGYAVKASDTFGASETIPAMLEQLGEVKIGRDYQGEVLSGQTVYVPTGGVVPSGADAVVMIEYIEKLGQETVLVYKSTAPGDGYMQIGEDYSQGKVLLEKGYRIKSKDIGVLATLGVEKLDVYKKIQVAVISTGNEIKDLGETIEACEIYDANGYALKSELEAIGCQVIYHHIFKDDQDAIAKGLKEALNQSDLVIMSGGSSTGEEDYTEKVINEAGKPGVFVHGLAMKPGKPTIIASIKGKLVIGLPGHPVSALIVFKVVLAEFIKKKMYQNEEQEPYINATLAENIKSADGKETYHMVELIEKNGEYIARPIYKKSGAISLLKDAVGYVKTEVEDEGRNKNEKVSVILL